MSTSLNAATSPTTLTGLGKSWTQENQANYAFSKLPKVLCLDRRSQRNNVTNYKIPDLSNFMLDDNGLRDAPLGSDIPASKALGGDDVAFTVETKGIPQPFDRPVGPMDHSRLEDLKSNLVPGVQSILLQGVEQAMVSFLESTTNYDNKTWSGSNVLDTFNSAINPVEEITTALLHLRKYQKRAGWALECFGDERVLTILSAYAVYSGGGAGSGQGQMLAMDEFLRRFQSTHRLDAVHSMGGAFNNASHGQTAVPADLAGGVLTFAIVDRRKPVFDLRSQDSLDAPDGSIALAMSRDPEVLSEIPSALKEIELFDGRVGFKVYSPRVTGSSLKLGVKWATAANLT